MLSLHAAIRSIAGLKPLYKFILLLTLTLALALIAVSAWIGVHGSVNFDEAYFLQAPSSMIKQGTYSTTYDGGRKFDSGLSTGPTVLLPVSLVFSLFGIGIVQARLVMLVYFLVMVVMVFQVSSILFGRLSAIFSLLLVLCLPEMFFFALKVLGEIPAIFFFMTACWLLIKNKGFLSGLFIGLAILTKFLFVLSIPAIFLLFLVDLVFSSEHRKQLVIFYSQVLSGLLLPTLIWEVVKFFSLGQSVYMENLNKFFNMITISSGTQEIFYLPTFLNRIDIFASPYPFLPSLLVFALIVIAIILNLFSNGGFKKVREWGPVSRASLFLLIFSLVYTVWWIFWKHLDWWRYLFPGYVIIVIAVSNSFAALLRRIDAFFSSSSRLSRVPPFVRYVASVLVILALFTPFFIEPAHAQTFRIKSYLFDDGLTTQYRVAAEVSKIEKIGGRIAYWTWWQAPEIAFLSQSQFKDISKVETRLELDEQVFNGVKAFVLVTPDQSQVSPEAWDAESIYCGDKVFELNGYQLFEYMPAYSRMYQEILKQADTGSMENAFILGDWDSQIEYYAKGIYHDGWAGRKASLWLKNESSYTTLVVEGNTNLEFIKKQRNSVKVYVMGILLGEEKIAQSGNFHWEFNLPDWTKSFKLLRIDFESNKVFTQKAPWIR